MAGSALNTRAWLELRGTRYFFVPHSLSLRYAHYSLDDLHALMRGQSRIALEMLKEFGLDYAPLKSKKGQGVLVS